jgi:hypothetical protein
VLGALETVVRSQMLPEVRSEKIRMYEVGEPVMFSDIADIVCCKKEMGNIANTVDANSCKLTVLLMNAISTVKFLVKLSYPHTEFSLNLGGLGTESINWCQYRTLLQYKHQLLV